jgi:ribosomal protein L7/L12
MAKGRKIEAIRMHRSLTGYGLKESKDVIEAAMNGNNVNKAC